jgi:hypothetical protein
MKYVAGCHDNQCAIQYSKSQHQGIAVGARPGRSPKLAALA